MEEEKRQEIDIRHRKMSTQDLIREYAWEMGRANEDDRKQTQTFIKRELNRRFNRVLLLMDTEEGTSDPDATYRALEQGI